MIETKTTSDYLTGRVADFKEALNYFQGGLSAEDKEKFEHNYGSYEDGDFLGWLNNYALWYGDDDTYRGKKLELSWGGYGDYFIFFESDDRILYTWLNWGVVDTIWLIGDSLEVMLEVRNWLFDI